MSIDKYILLIDDDADELEMFTDALNKLDLPVSFFCEQVGTIDDALVFLNKIRPDFIFLDFNMPLKKWAGWTGGNQAHKELFHYPDYSLLWVY